MASSSSSSPDCVGLRERFWAFAVDVLILFIVLVPLVLAIYGRDYIARSAGGYAGFWDFSLQVVVPAVATVLFWRFFGATPGKLAVGAKIVDARSLGAPSTGRLIGRYFAYLISALPLFLGFVWIAIDRRRQGWHDKIAGTLVIYDDD